MKYIMFTKHLESMGIDQIIEALLSVGVNGADLCVRPGYPVNPDNALRALPAAAKQFAQNNLSIPLVTAPGDFLDPIADETIRIYEACQEAGVENIKIGYWKWSACIDYWKEIDHLRGVLDQFQKLSKRTGVRTCIHNHSGTTMGLNASAVMTLVKEFDPSYVGVFADTGHLSIVGEPIDMALDIVKSHLAVISFKDLARRPGDRGGKVVHMGHGFVDWEATLQSLSRISFTGPISFHSEYGGEPVSTVIDLARIDVRFINRLRDKLSKE